MTKKRKEKRTAIIFVICALAFLGITWLAVYLKSANAFDYTKCQNKTIVTIGDEKMPLSCLNYYVMIEEETVDESAKAYNPENPLEYWGLYVNHAFVSKKAVEFVQKYYLRDHLYALEAKKNGEKLSDEELSLIETEANETANGLTDKQLEAGLTKEQIYDALCENQLADNYVLELMTKEGRTMTEEVLQAYYGIESYYFKDLCESYGVKWNDKYIDELSLGRITIN